MFFPVLLVISTNWKQFECPTAVIWFNKLWKSYNAIFSKAFTKHALVKGFQTWVPGSNRSECEVGWI